MSQKATTEKFDELESESENALLQGISILQLLNGIDVCNKLGYSIDSKGILSKSADVYKCSLAYIPLSGEIYQLVSRPQFGVYPIIFYDKDLNFISCLEKESGEYDINFDELEKPEGAVYCRVNSLVRLDCKYIPSYIDSIMSTLDGKLNKDSISYLKNTPPIIDSSNTTLGGFYKNGGVFVSREDYSYSKINVLKGSKIHISNLIGNGPAVAIPGYNKDDNYVGDVISAGGLTSSEFDIQIPYNVDKIILSFINGKYPILSYEKDKIPTIEETLNVDLSTLGVKSSKMPIITWIDDDCNYDGIQNVKTICDSLGIKAVFAAISLENEELKQRLIEYQNDGHQIVCHASGNHWKVWDSSSFDSAQVEKDMIKILLQMKENNIINSDYMIYPYGAYNDDIELLARKYFKAGVSIDNKSNHIADNGKYNIHRVFIENTHDLDYYKNIIDTAIQNGDWLVFGTHSAAAIGTWDTDLVTDVFSYAKEKAKIMTLSQALSYRNVLYDFFDL